MARGQKARRVRRGKPGNLAALKKELWYAVVMAGDLLDSDEEATRLRAVHAVSQAAAAYKALIEAIDLEKRIEALEEAQTIKPWKKVA